MIVHGLDLSYFTGKLEGYLRLKGLAYRFDPMDTAQFKALGYRVGVRQMPHLTLNDGRLLTDTVAIIDTLEGQGGAPGCCPSLTPADPVMAFLAELIEAFADEHLWRPALYYRWAFHDDALLASRRLAEGLMRDVWAPGWLKRAYILHRQRWFYLRGEGVQRRHGPVVEADYLALLEALEPVFRKRDWLMGDAPTRADVGLFGPLFRHFLSDPTPGRIMRERAPATAGWTLRLWVSRPGSVRSATDLRLSAADASDLAPLFRLISDRFLPEAAANARALAEGRRRVAWVMGGVVFRYRTNPYRAWRLGRLAVRFSALASEAQEAIGQILGEAACALLLAQPPCPFEQADRVGVRDRWWRPT